jgi:N-acetylglucosamine-6-sulfatase
LKSRKVREWLSVGLAVATVLLVVGCAPEMQEAPQKPNIVFVLTDDQDPESLSYMPTVQEELIKKGTTLRGGMVTFPRCCPSRATMLRGQYVHNHGVTGGPTRNGPYFRSAGLDESTVATWLHDAGYRTALVGKYLNGYDSKTYVPPGWIHWYAGINREVWADCFNQNGKERCYGRKKHPDSVLSEKAEKFVRTSEGDPRPLFIWLAVSAPHNPAFYPATDANKFSNAPLPKPPSFDEPDVSDKPGWVRDNPRLSDQKVGELTGLYRDRLRSLRMVDRTVANLTDALADVGRLENTYIFYFTDNGYMLGEHRLALTKDVPYLDDTDFPMIVRGPGVPRGASRDELVLNNDLAPTFADLAGAEVPDFVDGRSLVPLLRGKPSSWRTAALVEQGALGKISRPAYAMLRTESKVYVQYENGERELYDLDKDPYQLKNLAGKRPGEETVLSARLRELRNCSGSSCRAAEDGTTP